MTRRQASVLSLLSIIALVLGILTSRRLWFRLDLTKNRAYTISKVSRNIHAEIPDQVRITYYISDRLKQAIPVPGEIEDLLREYAAYSRGKIRVTARDPVKAQLAETVEQLGLQPRQIQTVEQDQASLATVYTGIVIEYLDKIEVLPWVISVDTLEYDLTSRIRALVRDVERQIGVIVGDSFRQWNQDFGYLNQTLSQAGYRIRLISPGDEIPDALPALFVLGGAEDLDDWALYRIDRYIRQGGKALFAAGSVFVDTLNGTLEARRMNDQGLLQMLAAYGVIVRPELALDKPALTLQYQTRSSGGMMQYRIIRYPLWIGVLAENGNSAHPVAARFSGLDLFWANPLELNVPAGLAGEPLFTSTGEAWAMQGDSFYTSPDIAYLFERDAAETRGTKILGVSLAGTFPSWFANAPKPKREGSDEELPDMPDSASPSRIVVVGNTDFATNLMQVNEGYHNLDFLLQAADWLGSDEDIIGIRSRQPAAGRLDKILDDEKRASAMWTSQMVNVVLVPLLVVGAGIVLARQRSKKWRTKNN